VFDEGRASEGNITLLDITGKQAQCLPVQPTAKSLILDLLSATRASPLHFHALQAIAPSCERSG
jgi:hypothetical protein